MAPGFKALHTNFNLANNDVETTFKFKLNEDVKVKLSHSKLTNYLVGEVEGDNWQAKYNFGTQDFKYEVKRDVAAGKLKIQQTIPAGKWELLPSPHISLTTSLLKKEGEETVKSKDRLKIGYNFQTSVADFEGAVWLDKRIKFKAEGNTHSELDGAVLAVSLKPDLPGVHKVGVKYNKTKGATLGATVKGFDGQVKVKAHASLQKKNVDAHVKVKHPSWEKSELHLHTNVPFNGKPSIVKIGVHYDV